MDTYANIGLRKIVYDEGKGTQIIKGKTSFLNNNFIRVDTAPGRFIILNQANIIAIKECEGDFLNEK